MVFVQVRTLLDAVTCSSLVKVVKALATPAVPSRKGKQQAATDEGDDMVVDNEPEQAYSQADTTKANLGNCAVIVKNLAILLQSFGMRDQPDNMRTLVDALVEVTRHVTAG